MKKEIAPWAKNAKYPKQEDLDKVSSTVLFTEHPDEEPENETGFSAMRQEELTWYDIRKQCAEAYEDILKSTLENVVLPRDARGWQLDNKDEFTEEERENAAQILNAHLKSSLMGITSYNTIVEDHIRMIIAMRMSKTINKYADMAYGDDPLYEVIAAAIDDLYTGLKVVEVPRY